MKDHSSYTLLIVDDETEIRELIALWLSQQGFNTVTSHNGEDAFKVIESQQIDFVISDIKMPICDGEQLLEKINKYYPDTPAVLLVTGQSELTEQIALAKGAKALLSKPFDFEVLLPLLEESLS